MKTIEILRLCPEILKALHKSGSKIDDYRYVELYNDYLDMRKEGDKTTYIVTVLSQRYNLAERTVYKLLKRLNTDCTICAAG